MPEMLSGETASSRSCRNRNAVMFLVGSNANMVSEMLTGQLLIFQSFLLLTTVRLDFLPCH